MKKITNSFIKNIVRQSLNESYGLLNEDLQEVEPYSIKTSVKHGTVPKGTSVNNMTYEKCPEGGICFEFLDQAKEDAKNLSGKDLINRWCSQTYMANAMGKPTKSGTALTNVTTPLFAQLTDYAMSHATITSKLKDLADFPTFCVANKKFKTYGGGDYGLGIPGTSDSWGGGDYGIENDDEGDRAEDYAITDGLFENSIAVSDEFYETWKKQLEEKYKATLDAAQKKKDDEAKKAADDAATTAKIGGAGQTETWLTSHPALGEQRQIKTTIGNGIVHMLVTDDPTINKFSYGYIVRNDNQTIQAIKVRNDDTTNTPFPIDPATDVNFQYALSKTDTWKYNDVIVSDNFIALTTDPDLENPFVQESYRHKGFRYNLLTEIELKYDKSKPQRGVEVGNIMSKLELPAEKNPTFGPQVLEKVINFQKTEGAKLTPPLRTDGVVDDATYNAIMAITPPAFELSIAKKSKGDDVKLVQQKLNLKDDGGFGTDTEIAVKAFQEKYKDTVSPPLRTDGVVDQVTFDQIKKLKGKDSRKVYSGDKTNYGVGDWIYIKARKGGNEGGIFDKQYYKIKSVSDDRQTVVLDLGVGNTTLKADDYKIDHVGGVTAKVLFGRNAEGETKETPSMGSDNETEGGETERGTGKRLPTGNGNGVSTTVDTEAQRKRKLRNQETCNTLRQIKQYLNNTKGLSMTVNCKWNQEIRNEVMLALTGGTPVPKEEPVVNTQPVPVTDKLF